jgi:hypothetical protein
MHGADVRAGNVDAMRPEARLRQHRTRRYPRSGQAMSRARAVASAHTVRGQAENGAPVPTSAVSPPTGRSYWNHERPSPEEEETVRVRAPRTPARSLGLPQLDVHRSAA